MCIRDRVISGWCVPSLVPVSGSGSFNVMISLHMSIILLPWVLVIALCVIIIPVDCLRSRIAPPLVVLAAPSHEVYLWLITSISVIRVSSIVLIIRVVVVSVVIAVVGVAVRTLVLSISSVIIVVGIVILIVPVIWLITLVVVWAVSPILVVVKIPVWVIWLLFWGLLFDGM